MSSPRNSGAFPTRAVLLSAVVLLGASLGLPMALASSPASGECRLVTQEANGTTRFVGEVHSDAPMRGAYLLSIRGTSGLSSSAITLDGLFEASPGQPARFGEVNFPGRAQDYAAEIELTLGSRRLTCNQSEPVTRF